MGLLIIGVLLFLIIFFPTIRCAICNLPFVIFYGCRDSLNYFRHKKYNEADFGDVRSYVAHASVSFGCGKTLTAVKVATELYHSFNNKKVWCPERKKFVTQKIHILSNVTFTNIPFEKLIDLKQFVQEVNDFYESDLQNDTLTVTYLIVDEAGSQFNSRSFKNNFDALFIKTLLTSRHFRASIVLTSQRQDMIDKLMRQITNVVIACKKTWRFESLRYYDGFDIDTAQNPALVEPFRRRVWFIRNKHFANYNTYELIGDLKKDCENGNRLTEQEILALQCNEPLNADGVVKNSKKFRRNRKKMTK